MQLASLDLSTPLLVAGAFWVSITFLLIRRSRRPPLPPGPSPDPVIGNVRQMGSGNLEHVFRQWGKEYGESPPTEEGVSFKVLIFRCRTDKPRDIVWTAPSDPQLIRNCPRTARASRAEVLKPTKTDHLLRNVRPVSPSILRVPTSLVKPLVQDRVGGHRHSDESRTALEKTPEDHSRKLQSQLYRRLRWHAEENCQQLPYGPG